MNTQFISKATSKLPPFWKLATIRCSIYAIIVGVSSFDAGVEGFDAFSDMTNMQLVKLALHIMVAMLGVWVAFLDQTLGSLKKPDAQPPTSPTP